MTPPIGDSVVERMAESARRTSIAGANNRASVTDPDAAGKALNLAQTRKMDPSVAMGLVDSAAPQDLRRLTNKPFDPSLSPAMSRWMADRNNAAIAQDDADALTKLDNSLRNFQPERNWLDEVSAATLSGSLGLYASMNHLGAAFGILDVDTVAQEVAKVTQVQRELEAGRSDAVQEYFERIEAAEGFGVVPEIFSDFTGFSAGLAESLAFSGPTILLGGAGAQVAGRAGLFGGTLAGGVITETGAAIGNRLGENYDLADANQARAAYRDVASLKDIRAGALRRGFTIGGINAMLSLFAGRRVAGAAGQSLTRRAIATAKEFGEQTVGEIVGEGAGGFAETGEVDLKESLIEGSFSGGQSVFDIAFGVSASKVKSVVRAAQATQDSESVRAAGEAFAQSKAAERFPEGVRQLIGEQVAGQDPELVAGYIDRVTWDEIHEAKGMDPAAALAEVMPASAEDAYLESGNTGQIRIPMGNYVQSLASDEAILSQTRFRPDGVTLEESAELLAEAEADEPTLTPFEEIAEETLTLAQEGGEVEGAAAPRRVTEADIGGGLNVLSAKDSKLELPIGLFLEGGVLVSDEEGGGVQVRTQESLNRSETTLAELAQSLEAEGQQRAITVDILEDGRARIVDGTHRVFALAQSGAQTVRVAFTPDSLESRSGRDTPANQWLASLPGQETAPAQPNVQQIRDEAEEVARNTSEQIQAAGRPKAEADLQGAFLGRLFQVMAVRYPQLGSVKELSERFVTEFRKEGARDTQVADAAKEILEQTAFHGTGKDPFKAFSLEFIGTGEGAAAFGWGLYFAESKSVAKAYRAALSRGPRAKIKDMDAAQKVAEEALGFDDVSLRATTNALNRIEESGVGPDELADNLATGVGLARAEFNKARDAHAGTTFDNVERTFDAMKKAKDDLDAALLAKALHDAGLINYTFGEGALATVELAPEQDEYLDWDKPISEQSKKVLKALKSIISDRFDEFNVLPSGNSTGEQIYSDIVQLEAIKSGGNPRSIKSKEAASKALAAAGIPGIRYLDATSRGRGEGTSNFVIFDDTLIDIVQFEQREGERQGAISFDPAKRDAALREFVVSLVEGKADTSTALHELGGHFWLEVVGDLSGQPDAPQALKDDFARILAFMGVGSREEITAKHHERWAAAYEKYLATGKAPSPALRRMFAVFRHFMSGIFRSVRGQGVELTPEIRAVMDRQLATDQEIMEAQEDVGPVTVPPEALEGLSEREREDYLTAATKAYETGVERLTREVQKSQDETAAKFRGEEMERIRAEVAAEIDARPEAIALASMRSDGQKIDRESAVDEYGDSGREIEWLEGLDLLTDEGGIDINEAGRSYGFAGADSLVQSMIGVANRDRLIDRISRARFAIQNPTLLASSGLREAAQVSVANEERSKVLMRAFKILQRKARRQGDEVAVRRESLQPAETLADLRVRVRNDLRNVPVRSIRPHRYRDAARRENKRVADRVRIGEDLQAAEALGRAMYNEEAFRQALRIEKRAKSDMARINKMRKPSFQRALTLAGDRSSHKQQVNRLLSRFGLKAPDTTQPTLTLRDWADERQEEGRSLVIPDFVLDERFEAELGDLDSESLNELRQVFDGILHIARSKNELLKNKQAASRGAAAEAIRNKMRSVRPEKDLPPGGETASEEVARLGAAFFAGGDKAGTWANIMDGGEDGGPAITHTVRQINEGLGERAQIRDHWMGRYQDLYLKHFSTDVLKGIDRQRDYAGAMLSHEDILSMLGLMGSEEGRQRLGLILNRAQQAAALATVTAEDVAFVNDRWAMLDEMGKLVLAQHERISGQTPKLIEARPYEVEVDGKSLELTGGYHPLDYKNPKRFKHTLKERALRQKSGVPASQQFNLSFTKGRVAEVDKLHVKLDRSVVTRHIFDVTHALALRERIIDVESVLGLVERDIDNHMGLAVKNGFFLWLEDTVSETHGPSDGLDRVIGAVRRRSVSAILSMRVISALKQTFGFKASVVRVGGKEGLANGAKWLMLASQKMNSSQEAFEGSGDWIESKSSTMASRAKGSIQRDLEDTRQRLSQRLRTKENHFKFLMLLKVQAQVDRLTWAAMYMKAMHNGVAEVDAIAQADQAVKDSQGGGEFVDLSAWERGGQASRLLTLFFTDAGVKFNMTKQVAARKNLKDPVEFAEFLASFALLYFTEAVVMSLGSSFLKSAFDGDDEDIADIVIGALRHALADVVDVIPVLREFSSFIRGFRYRGSSGLLVLQAGERFGQQVMQGEMDAEFWKSLNMLVGSLSGHPALLINDIADAAQQVVDGEVPTALVGIKPKR